LNDCIITQLEEISERATDLALRLVEGNSLPMLEGARCLVAVAKLNESLQKTGTKLEALIEKVATPLLDHKPDATVDRPAGGQRFRKATAEKEATG
jgi:hypothetical protein